jgi:protochlorophyllide reductase
MVKWTAQDMPDQNGRIAIITGANSGLGYESALALARKGATVVMGVRNLDKGRAALDALLKAEPNATPPTVMQLDLASLDSVRRFATEFSSQYDRLDILLNNAGVMAPPRSETEDGFELQFGINHLGHFALTGLLFDMLVATDSSRVVTVSSSAHRTAPVFFDDLQGKESYSRYGYYGQSKLANVLFMLELHRRAQAAGVNVASLGAQPGLANTELQSNTVTYSNNKVERAVYGVLMPLMSQSQEWGAFPQLYAATAPKAKSGEFYGPTIMGTRGYPRKETPNKRARNEADARRLWEISEELTGVTYAALQPTETAG